MDFNTLNGPVMSPEQIQQYLARLGLSGPIPLTLAGLTTLHQAHQQAVPFENLDILRKTPLSLEHQALFDKIVTGHRGGVCAELNTLYNWLLYSLGFVTRSYSTRIIQPSTPIQFRRHRIMGVELEGKLYTTDVGSTLEFPRMPLVLEEGLLQEDGACGYRFTQEPFYGWVLWQRRGEDWARVYGFTTEEQIDLDFYTPMFYFETHPDSNMRPCPRVSYYTPQGIRAIRNHLWTYERAGAAVQTTSLEGRWEEELRLLRESFGLDTAGLEGFVPLR